MATQREKDAAEYLQKHRIMELLENLSSLMFYHRPGSDPHPHTASHAPAEGPCYANTGDATETGS